MKSTRLACIGMALALASRAARSDTTSDFLPELDIWIKLNKDTRVLLASDDTRDRDSGDRTKGQGAAYLDYRLNDRISFRGGYMYSVTPATEPDESNSVEHRWILDTSYNWRLSDAAKLTDRVRLDFRDIAGSYSQRIRDRLKLEYETHIGRQAVNPYGNIEAYYDTRYDTVSRYRLELGATTPLSNDIEIDLFLGRQRDTQPSTKFSTDIGITLTLSLR
jgi:Protein of unknown function (DUF2490)